MHRWFIGFYKVLESFAPRMSIKCERSLFTKVQLVLSKTFPVLCSWLVWQGICILKRGSWLGPWWNLFMFWIWMRRFASFNKYQIAFCFLAPTIFMLTENSDSWCWSEGLPVIVHVKQRTRSPTISFFFFLQMLQNFSVFIYAALSWLPSPWSTQFISKVITLPEMPLVPSLPAP